MASPITISKQQLQSTDATEKQGRDGAVVPRPRRAASHLGGRAGAYRGLGQPIALSQYPGYAGSVEYSIYHPGYLGRGGHPADRADAHPGQGAGLYLRGSR